MKVINATGVKSKAGTIVKISADKEKLSFTLVGVGHQSNAFVVVDDGVPDGKPCEITNTGSAKVLVSGNFRAGDIVRSRKKGDKDLSGAGFKASDDVVPYLQIGVVLSPVRNGLADVWLDIKYVSIGADGTWVFGTAEDNTTIESDGTMVKNGNATVWDDIRIVPSVFDVPGGTDPDIISYQPAGSGTTFKVYAFAKGDEGYFTLQIPHGYKVGSTIYAHLHWTPGPRGNEENGNVVHWALDYSMAAINANFPASNTIDLSDACDGTDHKHQMTNNIAIAGTGFGISSQMIGRVYRNATADTWAGTGANLPIFLEIDFHVEMDTLGSREVSTK